MYLSNEEKRYGRRLIQGKTYNPIIVSDMLKITIKHIDPDAPDPPANWGIRKNT